MPPKAGVYLCGAVLLTAVGCACKSPPPRSPDPAPAPPCGDVQGQSEPAGPPDAPPAAEEATIADPVDDPIQLFIAMTDEACACGDLECVDLVQRKYEALVPHDPPELTAEQMAQVEEIGGRLLQCVMRLSTGDADD